MTGEKKKKVFLPSNPVKIPCLANGATQASSSKQSKNSPLPGSTSKVPFSPINLCDSTWNKYKSFSLFYRLSTATYDRPNEDL